MMSSQMKPERGTLRHDGIEIPYEVRGEGEPILLIHGGIGQIQIWEPVAVALARTHRVIAYDQRGHGSSRAAGTPDFRVHIDDAAAIVEQVVGGPTTVVGWSGGGGVGLGLALERPELVDHLISMEGFYSTGRPDLRLLGAMFRFKRAVRKRPDDAVDGFMSFAFGYRSGETAWDEVSKEVRQLFRADVDGLKASLRLHRYGSHMEWAKARDVTECPVPVTWVGGEQTIEPFQKMHRNLEAAKPDLETVMVPGANHALPVADPTAFASVVRELAGATARTS